MDHWTELAWEAERDEADAYAAAADAAEGERLRAALEQTKPRWAEVFGIDPKFTDGAAECLTCDGCGKVSSGDDAEPWSAWEALPPESQLGVRLGLVFPVECTACGGTGRAS